MGKKTIFNSGSDPHDASEYDLWFRAKVQEALDTPFIGIPHDAVARETRAVIDRIAGKD